MLRVCARYAACLCVRVCRLYVMRTAKRRFAQHRQPRAALVQAQLHDEWRMGRHRVEAGMDAKELKAAMSKLKDGEHIQACVWEGGADKEGDFVLF